MGQYHKLVNLDKQEVVDPHGLGFGSKQHEHTGPFDGSLSDAIYLLVMSSPNRGGGDWASTGGVSGRWCGDRVVVVGDYTEEGDIEGAGRFTHPEHHRRHTRRQGAGQRQRRFRNQ
jgi:hypothetical protein